MFRSVGFGMGIGAVTRGPAPGWSAVLMVRNIDPYGAAKDTPRMWINRWAPMPISETYGLATNNLRDDGQVLRTDGNLVIHELLDLPSDWPLVDKAARR